MTISIEADKRGLIVRTPYSAQFVSELKRPQILITSEPEHVTIIDDLEIFGEVDL